jgi:protein TonB
VISSAVVHGATAGGLFFWMGRHAPPPIVAELDLSMAPLAAPNPGGGSAPRSQAWTLPKRGLPPPPPRPAPSAPPPAPEPEAAPMSGAAPGTGDGGGGTGEGQGAYVPASQTARQPRWVSGFISSRDYPKLAKEQGKDGRVVVSILIDEKGRVRDASLVQGGYEVLNEVALRKLRAAVFTPAYDASGKPVPCKAVVPIRFELK